MPLVPTSMSLISSWGDSGSLPCAVGHIPCCGPAGTLLLEMDCSRQALLATAFRRGSLPTPGDPAVRSQPHSSRLAL